MRALEGLFARHRDVTLAGVPDGYEGRVVGDLARQAQEEGLPLLLVARDAPRLALIEQSLRFFAPRTLTLSFPAWDCLPYDRVSPNADIGSARMAALHRLTQPWPEERPFVVLTTANAAVQRVVPRDVVEARALTATAGGVLDLDVLVGWLENNGFLRTPTVREVGEYAVRGGIVDLYAPGDAAPVRLDFFGDTLETVRPFDPATQRTTGQMPRLELVPASEVVLTEETITRFRSRYREAFGAVSKGDALYESVSEGLRFAGMEHWLPLFYERTDTIFDYLEGAPALVDYLVPEAVSERRDQVLDHYEARRGSDGSALADATPYKPITPDLLYLSDAEWTAHLSERAKADLTPFAAPETNRTGRPIVDLGGRGGRSFAAERTAGDVNVFDALVSHIVEKRKEGAKIVLASWTDGSRERLGGVLKDHGLERLKIVSGYADVEAAKKGETALAVLPVESGFEAGDLIVVGEQDVMGDRFVRSQKRKRKASDALTEASSLAEGDLVVHVEHGIGRFVGLENIEAAGAPHDVLRLEYAGGDRLYLPVENIELLTRYGSENAEAVLDKLGGGAWQARKAKLKKRILEMAGDLIRIAAKRVTRTVEKLPPPAGLYDEFAARFPYEETEDQQIAIEAVLSDLASGTPMDRLVCGDVGFGKTEVALRAAFVAAMNGKQVAIVVPTTLLARQHFRTFAERFRGLPLNVRQASRLVKPKEVAETKKALAAGTVDIVVGTHALLAQSVAFKDLGLLIIDEEQHFGVKHKERLKELRADVHVLTLSATPIPRTLQLALTGVRELSLIATPPVDRLAVRTFISPFDALTVREALMRERVRGGQSFYVCPRVSDLEEVRAFLEAEAPELKVAVAHGQMAPGQLDDVMNAFYDGHYDVLLSTTIIESGLDIPTANTMVTHRSEMFGLAQLYQLRGRIGRSKTRAYALFTTPANKKLTATAERRLKVLQSLDTLGAGFQLASHDLDIRGAGNLLGEEQSGHIREVGYELYQQMLEEAVASLKAGDDEVIAERWSPQITVGMAVMIPESYVGDLQLRLSLYRRLADLEDAAAIDAFGAELVDRFGSMPDEVEQLLKLVYVKQLCRRANIEKVDAGPKGAVITLRDNSFANPAGLVRYIGEQGTLAKIRPDQKLVIMRDWPTPDERLKGVATILTRLAAIAEEEQRQAA